MTDASASTSLAASAKQLTALSRAKSDDEKDTQEQGQVETALTKLNAELAKLANVLAAHRKLTEAGVTVDALPDLAGPAERLRDQVATVGRPSAQFLNVRIRDVNNAASAISGSDLLAWREWAEAAIAALPLNLQPRLNPIQRGQVTNRIAEMKKAAGTAPVSSAGVTTFLLSLEYVKDIFASVELSDVDGVLGRFERGQIRLADLNEEELAMLRGDASLTDQLYLVLQ